MTEKPNHIRMIDDTQVYEFDSVVSTMDVAREYEKSLSSDASFVVSAHHQSQGRGRQGKMWVNAQESILFTIILPTLSFKDMSGFSLVVGIGIVEALSLQSRGVKLKWPNDIYNHDGKKIGGILVEVSDRILIGIGLNLKGAPHWGLSLDTFGLTDRVSIEDAVIRRILQDARFFARTGFLAYQEAFSRLDYLKGRNVLCSQTDTSGVCIGVDVDGALLVNSSDGVSRVVAGSVTVC